MMFVGFTHIKGPPSNHPSDLRNSPGITAVKGPVISSFGRSQDRQKSEEVSVIFQRRLKVGRTAGGSTVKTGRVVKSKDKISKETSQSNGLRKLVVAGELIRILAEILPKRVFDENCLDDCGICWISLGAMCPACAKAKPPVNQDDCKLSVQDDCMLVVGQCNHVYHLHCINSWLKTTEYCPHTTPSFRDCPHARTQYQYRHLWVQVAVCPRPVPQ